MTSSAFAGATTTNLLRAALDAAPNGLVVCDEAGVIVLVNARLRAQSAWSDAELVGQPIAKLLSNYVTSADLGAGTLIHRDGSTSAVSLQSRALAVAGPADAPAPTPFTMVSLLDEPALAAARLEASLQEKDALLREVHHRVKNNLQLISSLLKLQSRYCKDAEAKGMFEQSQSRVASIAAVHDRIYFGADLGKIRFDKYLTTLTAQWQRRPEVRIVTSGLPPSEPLAPVTLPVDLAIPCGLIVNELVLNALQHGFPAGHSGTVRISAGREDRAVTIVVADSGVGVPADLVVGKTGTFGLELVSILLRQLRGAMEVERPGQGATFILRFELRA